MADLTRLTKLKTLHLNNFDDKKSKVFANELFAHLPALNECVINGRRVSQGRLIEIIGLVPNMKVITVVGKLGTLFTVPFYKKLIKSRALSDGQIASEENRLVIHTDHASAIGCIQKLGKRYKPSIVELRYN